MMNGKEASRVPPPREKRERREKEREKREHNLQNAKTKNVIVHPIKC
jgi:hypothetical protein